MSSIREDNIDSLVDKRSRDKIIKEAILEIKIVKNTRVQALFCILVAFVLSILLVRSNSTVEASRILFSTVLDVDMAFFAVIFGSYAVFQALMTDDILKHFLRIKNNILADSNKTFLNLSILYIIGAVVSFVAKIISEIVTNDAYIYSILMSDIVYSIFLIPYLIFCLLLFLENINFVINLYRMFNVCTLYRALDMLESENKQDREE